MASQRIKGITVEIGGDTSKLSDSLKNVDKSLRSTQSQLRDVNKLLKLDPGNTELIAQKQRLLASAIETTESRLETLKTAARQADAALAEGKISQDQYDGLQREIIETEQKLGSLKDEAKGTSPALEEVGESAKKSANGGFTVLKGVLANLATSAIQAAGNALRQLGSGLVSVGKAALENYSSYEQLTGGVETLFKGSASAVEAYASNAYRTAGLSANEYMDTVTSFSASLISSLGGDTSKAALEANTAITDMSDNANKMGTSMGDIQNAYQGFAKQNYTMLDNLKLGYGGTKEEMQRLLDDAQKLTGKKYDLSNFADITEAIHAIQTEMGITGTTSKEAASTIEGSINTLKASWTNFETALAGGGDLTTTALGLATSFGAVVDNIAPRIGEIVSGITQAVPILMKSFSGLADELIQSLLKGLPTMIQAGGKMLESILQGISEVLPTLNSVAMDIIIALANGLVQGLPKLISTWSDMWTSMIDSLTAGLPKLLQTLLGSLPDVLQSALSAVGDIGQALLPLIESIGNFLMAYDWGGLITRLIQTVVRFLGTTLPQIIQGVMQLINGLVQQLPTLIQNLIAALPTIITQIIDAFVTIMTEDSPLVFQGALTLFMTIVEAIPQIVVALVQALPQIIEAIVTGLAGFGQALFDTIIKAIPFVLDWTSQMVSKMKQAAQDMIKAFADFLQKLPSRMMGVISPAIDAVVTWGGNLVSKVKEAASNFVNNFVDGVKDIGQKMLGKINGAIDAVVTWGGNLASKGAEAASKLFNAVVDGVSGIPNHMLTLGRDIVTGIWNGIAGGVGWLYDRVTGFANGLVNKFKSAFDSHSPSKLMAKEVGRWIPAGIAQGIEDNADVVDKAIKSISGKASSTSLNFGVSGGSAVLSRVANGYGAGTVINNINNSRTINQTNNSPRALSRLEIYRQTRQAVKRF